MAAVDVVRFSGGWCIYDSIVTPVVTDCGGASYELWFGGCRGFGMKMGGFGEGLDEKEEVTGRDKPAAIGGLARAGAEAALSSTRDSDR